MKSISTSGSDQESLLPVMKKVPQWICWANHRSSSVKDKIPLDTRRYFAGRREFRGGDYTNPDIWLEYSEAVKKVSHPAVDGIGFSMLDKNICFIDIDNCVNKDLEVPSEVFGLISSINSYAELSPSKSGIHIYCAGELESYGSAPEDSPIEISAFDRSWATVTFDHIRSSPTNVKSSPNNLEKLCQEYNLSPTN